MYKVIWDQETNGVILTDKNIVTDNIIHPRPVFFEELNLLGFDKHWKYPKTKEPLLWANGRRYYYKGEWVAEAKGGNIFEPPQIIVTENGKNLALKPIDIDTVVKKNQEALFVLENEAIDFVEHTYKTYKKGRNKVDCFAVSFSGGKDSQVVLDIVSRIIPPDEYIVVFTDTDMELPSTYETVKETEAYYKKLYPELRFYTAKGKLSSEESWRKFGPPSRIHRWCCTVHKTAPYMSLINCMFNGKRQPKILTFEGIRAEESPMRKGYSRVSKGIKHTNQINARVIRNWNSAEVFLYIFYRRLKINQAYRYGLSRVGCSICPFGSEWSEYIISQKHSELATKYINILREYVSGLGFANNFEIAKYISERQWKKRGGGMGIATDGTGIDLIYDNSTLRAVLFKPKENFLNWIKTTGNLHYRELENKFCGEIKVRDEIFKFELENLSNNRQIIKLKDISKDIIFLNKLKKVLNKSTYCIHCGSCEVECPTGALKVSPSIKVDTKLCTHCGNCLDVSDKGCLVAQSLAVASNASLKEGTMRLKGIDRYLSFGLRKDWLNSFLNQDDWLETNSLGNKQRISVKNWLYESDLINKTGQLTKLGGIFKNIVRKNEKLVWAVLWNNLFYNSALIKWYVSDVDFGKYTVKALTEKMSEKTTSPRTAYNSIKALANMMGNSPIGHDLNMGIIEEVKGVRYIRKLGTDDIHPIAIAYSLYRYAQSKNRRDLTVSEFYREDQKEGPYRLFGISREKFENILRYLQEDKNGVVKVELGKGLDNIRLREDLNHIEVLELLTQEAVK